MAGLSLGSEQAAARLCELGAKPAAKPDLLVFGRVVARLRELEVWVATVVAKTEAATVAVKVEVATAGLGLGGFEQAMAKPNTSDFERATAGLGELGTRATAMGLNSDGGTWGRLKQET